jgi:hypothetical protein
MIKTLVASAAISGLMISGALAQQSPDAAASTPKFISSQNPDQWAFSKFKGTDVLGPNDETIGSVNDLLFDKSGKIMGMMVGVGGFLGIGQKNVAIDMSGFQVVPASTGSSRTTTPSTGSNDPTNVKLKVAWTKDQLQQAPDFQYYKAPSSTAGDSPATTGMAPRPGGPATPPPPRP